MSQSNAAELLRLHRSTRGLDEQEINRIATHAEVIRVDNGVEVYRPNEPAESLLLVIAGHLSMSLVLPSGEEKTVLYVGRDDQIGLLGLVHDDPVPARVVALQQSLLVRIPREAATELMREIPLWNRNLLRSIAPRFRDALLGDKGKYRARFIAFIHTSEKTREVTPLLIDRLTQLGEIVGMIGDHDPTLSANLAHAAPLFDSLGNRLTVPKLRELFGSWHDADRLVLDERVESTGGLLAETLAGCEATYWFCSSDSSDLAVDALKPIVRDSPHLREKITVVHVLGKQEQVAPRLSELAQVCQGDVKLHLNDCSLVDSTALTRNAGLERIVHSLRGVSVGLALGGGAARGMAHLGVLRVLDQAGITIDRMSGTSAGALTGILYAAGYSGDFCIEHFAHDLKPDRRYQMLPYGDALYMLMKFRRGGWDKMLRKYLRDWRLEQLAIPFSSVAVDLIAAETVIRREGDAVDALLESINLPGIARPVLRDGKALVDGGVLNVVPANVLTKQGANFVVSSDVSAKISFEFAGIQPGAPTDKAKRRGGIAALIRMRTVQDRNIRSIGGDAADIVIEPDVSTVELTDFKNAAKIAKLGYTAAEQSLPELRRVLHEIDPQLFPIEASSH